MWLSLFLVLGLFEMSRTCEPIRVELCRGLGYNLTGMPNLVGHELQGDADFTLQTFSSLIQYGCSAQLHFFLCSVYIPMCTEKVNGPIGPCRGLCESVRSRCFPVLQGFGFPWPAELNCSKFPEENNHEHMCMEGPREVNVAAIPASQISRLVFESKPTHRQTFPCIGLSQPHLYVYMNRSGRCVQMCDADVLFTGDEKRLADTWLAFCAVLATVCSLFGLMACIIEGLIPFGYPQRALLYLAVCYTLAGVGWAIRLLIGRQISCQMDSSDPSAGELLIQAALAVPVKHNCALVFLMLFYFNNSASIWWVITAFSWFLEAGLNWSSSRINQHSTLFHLAAWGLPAVQTILVVVLRRIDADELTGTCYVGNQDSESLLQFVLLPQLTLLLLVISLLLLGLLIGLGSNHVHCQWITVLGIFYVIPMSSVIVTLIYEYTYRDDWVIAVPSSPVPLLQPHAMVWVFLLRITMSSMLGVIIGLWICLAKSKTWNNIFWSIDTRQKQQHQQQHQLQDQQNILHNQKFHQIKTNNKENINHYYHQTPPRAYKTRKHRKPHSIGNGNETLV